MAARTLPEPLPGPVTARDLARHLGVSQSMVSRAFSPGASVAPEMRSRILAAAAELGYRPNVIASALSRRRSGIIGVVMGELSNPFYPAVLECLSEALRSAGFQCLLLTVPRGEEADACLPMLRQYHVDGVVLTSANLSSAGAAHWIADGRAAVLFNRTAAGESALHSVACDNVAGGRMAADALLAGGRRRLAFVAGRSDTSTSRERERGFREALAEQGLAVCRIEAGAFSYEAGHRAALQALEQSADGIFFANDILALGGLDALRHTAGLRVPDEVAVVGFDDIPMAGWPAYNLTTLRQPVEAMAQRTVDLLQDGAAAAQASRLPASLVRRGSL
jgi:DNA-binding LacI/PurR family transcriptional regulator